MSLAAIDWIVIIGFFLLIVGVGLSYTQKAGENIESFFLGGRNLPWYIAGISMVATTFAADTPLAVTELVGQNGIAGNWLWWNFLAGGMLTTFFFARLWRKANVLTEVELIELRYSGAPASFLRGFKSIYLGVFLNVIIIAWVNVALMSLIEVFFGVPSDTALMYTALAMVLVASYASMSGLLGVAITDVIQFVIAITSCIILAVLVVNSEEIGGIENMKQSLTGISDSTLDFFPTISDGGSVGAGEALGLSIGAFLAYTAFQWWASWYPGAEPGGGGYIAQRMMSTKTETGAVYATLLFQVTHYCLRPWPWIIVGLCALSLYNLNGNIQDEDLKAQVTTLQATLGEEGIRDKVFTMSAEDLDDMAADNKVVQANLTQLKAVNEQLATIAKSDTKLESALVYSESTGKGFVLAMKDFLPNGLKGLLLIAFFAAYMSTISTQLNWGASYLINDFYKRFLRPEATDKQLVTASRIGTVLIMLIGLGVTTQLDSISGAWGFLMQCGAGLGLVLILRWYWWRVNAWAEIAAMFAPFVATAFFAYQGIDFPDAFLMTIGFTTVVWLVVMYMTPPTNEDTLQHFYNTVEPDGAWSKFRDNKAQIAYEGSNRILNLIICWLSGITMTYGILFFIGKVILQEWQEAGIWAVVALIGLFILRIFVKKTNIF